ncbi:hypothetical protein NC651_026827 [Populus alba x Populus x berolinensis]|nr:hypothetical protein NC651_026827 [Populus alba x Populus x berolinensis]
MGARLRDKSSYPTSLSKNILSFQRLEHKSFAWKYKSLAAEESSLDSPAYASKKPCSIKIAMLDMKLLELKACALNTIETSTRKKGNDTITITDVTCTQNLPVVGWNVGCLSKILQGLGRIIGYDKMSLRFSSLYALRLLIGTMSVEELHTVVNL